MSVIIYGLPEVYKLPKITYLVKSKLKRHGIDKLWMKNIVNIPGSVLQSLTIDFSNDEDAQIAAEVFNGFGYQTRSGVYPLSTEFKSKRSNHRSPSPYSRDHNTYRNERYRGDGFEGRSSRYGGRNSRGRERSRSPHYNRIAEVSKLDMEIELLKKQRMIIEEERRLLLERKKLEMVKEFGPSAISKLESFEDRDRRRPEPKYQPRRSPPQRRERYPPTKPATFTHKYLANKQPIVREFILPVKTIINEMKSIITKYAGEKAHLLTENLLKTTIRKRIAIALEDKPYMSHKDIVKLYRKEYPASADEELVAKLVKQIKSCHLPELIDTKGATSTKTRKKRNKGKGVKLEGLNAGKIEMESKGVINLNEEIKDEMGMGCGEGVESVGGDINDTNKGSKGASDGVEEKEGVKNVDEEIKSFNKGSQVSIDVNEGVKSVQEIKEAVGKLKEGNASNEVDEIDNSETIPDADMTKAEPVLEEQPKTASEEPEISTEEVKEPESCTTEVVVNKPEESIEQRGDCGVSMNSSEIALALDDSNQDWGTGEDWTDLNASEDTPDAAKE